MFRTVTSWCGKQAYKLGLIARKSCGAVSTAVRVRHVPADLRGVKASFIPTSFQSFTPRTSPTLKAFLPLIEHYFYPVSTPPTIRTTRLKF
jgi:hypothetical protein